MPSLHSVKADDRAQVDARRRQCHRPQSEEQTWRLVNRVRRHAPRRRNRQPEQEHLQSGSAGFRRRGVTRYGKEARFQIPKIMPFEIWCLFLEMKRLLNKILLHSSLARLPGAFAKALLV